MITLLLGSLPVLLLSQRRPIEKHLCLRLELRSFVKHCDLSPTALLKLRTDERSSSEGVHIYIAESLINFF